MIASVWLWISHQHDQACHYCPPWWFGRQTWNISKSFGWAFQVSSPLPTLSFKMTCREHQEHGGAPGAPLSVYGLKKSTGLPPPRHQDATFDHWPLLVGGLVIALAMWIVISYNHIPYNYLFNRSSSSFFFMFLRTRNDRGSMKARRCQVPSAIDVDWCSWGRQGGTEFSKHTRSHEPQC